MSNAQTAFKERHKPRFLRAFSRIGKIAPAAKATRISRDAVYDWLRTDEGFRRCFLQAREVCEGIQAEAFREHVWMFYAIVKDFIPLKLQPAVITELNIKLSQIEFKKGKSSTAWTLSRTKDRLPSSPFQRMATLEDGGSRALYPGKNGSAHT